MPTGAAFGAVPVASTAPPVPAGGEYTMEPPEDWGLKPKAKIRPMRTAAARTRDERTMPTTSPLERPVDTGSGVNSGDPNASLVARAESGLSSGLSPGDEPGKAPGEALGNWSGGKGVREGSGVGGCGLFGALGMLFGGSDGNSCSSDGIGEAGVKGGTGTVGPTAVGGGEREADGDTEGRGMTGGIG